jgi:RHS repeat-associated protein
VITDQAGEVVYKADYFAFGTQFVKDGDFEELHGFTGKEYDPDIGLYYFNARWYDPDLGRFISEDPVADPNNPNLYSYCGNNPVMRVDPTGKFWWVFPLLGGLDAYLCGGDFMQGFVMGALTGAIGGAVGSVLQNTAWGAALAKSSGIGFSAVSGAIGGGITGELFGEGFEKGAVHGAVAGAISYGVDLRFGEYASRSIYNRLVIAGLKGGLNALARGEDFVEAFAYGVAYGLIAQKATVSVPSAANHPENNGELSLTEKAKIADHVYDAKEIDKGKEVLPGIILVDVHERGSLKIGVYKKVEADNQYIIANRGSRTLQCWVNNFLSLFGLSPDARNSIEYVTQFVEDHPDADITYIGHSKGGAEAIYNAIATNRNATVFKVKS